MATPRVANPKTRAIEHTKPELFADFLVQWAEDPECSVNALARRCGLPQKTAHQIVKRLETRYQPVVDEVKKVTTQSILSQIDEALPLALSRMSDEDLVKKASYRDLATGMGIMIDKRQLLRGEPTQILSLEKRQQMDALAPAIVAEIERRGLKTIDADYTEVPMPAEAVSRTARKQARREDSGRV